MTTSVSLPNEEKLKQQLSHDNPILSPNQLQKYFPQYALFTRQQDSFGIWQTPTFKQKISANKNKYSKVLLMLSGIAGGGKDAIRETIATLHPHAIFKIITATSRKPRPDETNKKDYYFYDSPTRFKQAIKNNEFLEWVYQGERLYGLPKISLSDSLQRPETIIVTHVEMTAWPKIEKFIQEDVTEKPFILKVFVMPQMKYLQYAHEWLPSQRQDYTARMSRSLWELDKAPHVADLIISNHIDQKTPFLKWQTLALLKKINKTLTSTAKLKLALAD